VVDDLIVHGSVDACRERIAEYQAAGLDTPVIAVLPTGEDPAALALALTPPA
jgi:alkanesulfonate monooxygenase SsuD/methylene tetrahydromethanopterin reductase-like flavin-dependent oxidoreductase (luciferase family)